MKTSLKTSFKLGLILILIAMIAAGCGTQADEPEIEATPAVLTNFLITEGKLIPVNYLDQSFSISGEVDEVLVSEGEAVRAGQPIARLVVPAAVSAQVAASELELVNAQNALDDLLETYTDGTALAQAQKDVAEARQRLDDVEEDLEDINYIGEQDDIDKAWRNLQEARRDMNDAKGERDRYDNPNSRGYKTANFKYKAAYNTYAIALSDYNYLTGNTVDELERAVIEADVELAREELEDAEKAYQEILDWPENSNIAAAEARLAAAQTALESANETLASHELSAKMDGTVVGMELQPGQKVSANTPILTLADYSNWIVETDNLTEIDVPKVSYEQQVEVVLDAMPSETFMGEVIDINLRAEEKRGDMTFTVTILLEDASPEMRWGMTAAVNFIP